jgi:hypothetical protein
MFFFPRQGGGRWHSHKKNAERSAHDPHCLDLGLKSAMRTSLFALSSSVLVSLLIFIQWHQHKLGINYSLPESFFKTPRLMLRYLGSKISFSIAK